MENRITFFKGLRSTTPVETLKLSEVLTKIKEGKWKDKVDKCKIDLKYKDFLPCFTPTGIFSHRSITGMESYNGIICLDIDHVENPQELKEKAQKLSYVHAAFITPSGKGLKVIIMTNGDVDGYKENELKVSSAFFHDTGAARDNRCKDIARIQYVSYDPELYYNSESQIFNVC